VSSSLTSIYPDSAAQRDRWIVERRGPREHVDADKPYAFHVEEERFASGELGPVATVFLSNRECPWRCAMCDLWRNTLPDTVPPGAIPRQIDYALSQLPAARQIKLYNSGSFFDPRAIPPEDYPAIATRVSRFERVIVESHPALIGENCFKFQQLIQGTLEVAMGLETANPTVLDKLNKRMTLEQYATAADRLRTRSIALRSFILVQPPFMPPDESLHWTCRSIDFALNCGATAVTLIPTRGGHGAMDELATYGQYVPANLSIVEDALDYGINLGGARVFADLWDISRVQCPSCCCDARVRRLRSMNASQTSSPRVRCDRCEASA
jgi:radical SAM enzyme (TIGR01210 family)